MKSCWGLAQCEYTVGGSNNQGVKAQQDFIGEFYTKLNHPWIAAATVPISGYRGCTASTGSCTVIQGDSLVLFNKVF